MLQRILDRHDATSLVYCLAFGASVGSFCGHLCLLQGVQTVTAVLIGAVVTAALFVESTLRYAATIMPSRMVVNGWSAGGTIVAMLASMFVFIFWLAGLGDIFLNLNAWPALKLIESMHLTSLEGIVMFLAWHIELFLFVYLLLSGGRLYYLLPPVELVKAS